MRGSLYRDTLRWKEDGPPTLLIFAIPNSLHPDVDSHITSTAKSGFGMPFTVDRLTYCTVQWCMENRR